MEYFYERLPNNCQDRQDLLVLLSFYFCTSWVFFVYLVLELINYFNILMLNPLISHLLQNPHLVFLEASLQLHVRIRQP